MKFGGRLHLPGKGGNRGSGERVVLVLEFAEFAVEPPGELSSWDGVNVALERDVVSLVGLYSVLQLDPWQASEFVDGLDLFAAKFGRSVADGVGLLRGGRRRFLEPSLRGLQTTIADPGIVVQRESSEAAA